jgi:hypothetical protein
MRSSWLLYPGEIKPEISIQNGTKERGESIEGWLVPAVSSRIRRWESLANEITTSFSTAEKWIGNPLNGLYRAVRVYVAQDKDCPGEQVSGCLA